MFSLARAAGRQAVASASCRGRFAAPALRGFAGVAASKVVKTVQAEIKHEQEQYEQAKEIKAFLSKSDFKLEETDGDVNMTIVKEVGDKKVSIEWQLNSPFNPDMEEGEGEEGFDQEATDFVVNIEKPGKGSGLSFYCSTQAGEEHRYIIGSVKAFGSVEERDSHSSYNGPEFEDVDEKLQENLDELLAEYGMDSEVCDFIDATALDKEQREYIRWLQLTRDFLQE